MEYLWTTHCNLFASLIDNNTRKSVSQWGRWVVTAPAANQWNFQFIPIAVGFIRACLVFRLLERWDFHKRFKINYQLPRNCKMEYTNGRFIIHGCVLANLKMALWSHILHRSGIDENPIKPTLWRHLNKKQSSAKLLFYFLQDAICYNHKCCY